MLAIRMQRTGRKGHAMFRVVVQDSRRTPTSGSLVASLGSYDPHAKTIILNKEKASFYLEHGAQPSERVAKLLQGEGVKLPSWVKQSAKKDRTVRHADKRRSTTPAVAEKPAATPVVEAPAEEPTATSTEVASKPTTSAAGEATSEPVVAATDDEVAEDSTSEAGAVPTDGATETPE